MRVTAAVLYDTKNRGGGRRRAARARPHRCRYVGRQRRLPQRPARDHGHSPHPLRWCSATSGGRRQKVGPGVDRGAGRSRVLELHSRRAGSAGTASAASRRCARPATSPAGSCSTDHALSQGRPAPPPLSAGRRVRDALVLRKKRHFHPEGRSARRRVPRELRRARGRGRSSTAPGAAGRHRRVWGCGGVGLNTIQARGSWARPRSSRRRDEPEARVAEEFGATHVVDASREDPVARVHALAGRGGVDFASRWSELRRPWSRRSWRPTARHLRGRRGVAPPDRLSIDPSLLLQQRVLTGTRSRRPPAHGRAHADHLYMSGKYKLDEMISRRLPLGS